VADGVLEHLDPEVFDEAERKKLEADLKKARAETRLSIRKRGDGASDIHARVPDSIATRLKTYLEAFTAPRHTHTDAKPSGGGSGSLADGAVVGSRYRDPATGERL